MAFNTIRQLFANNLGIANNQTSDIISNDDSKKNSETYSQYGVRICGKATASLNVLTAFLPKVYNGEKQRQFENEQVQQQKKSELQLKLTDKKNQLAKRDAEKESCERQISDTENCIAELKSQLIEAENKHGDINKVAKIKLVTGLIILAILTLYLFIFYSSTFYSAFFKEFNTDITVGAAMFDPHALPNALSNGFGELLFIICAPIIFMGLGYGLHFFSVQQGKVKYLKIISLVAVTFIFDTILAYLIAQKIYIIESWSQLGDVPEFSLKLAISDINVWAVIFCGFIVYIIWGIVFSMTMTAYEDLRSNKKEILKIKSAIEGQKNILANEKRLLEEIKVNQRILGNECDGISASLSNDKHYDTQIIRQSLNDFFSGWMTMMSALDMPKTEQDKANKIYNDTVSQLFS